jgi:hypothetical protein
MAGPNVDISIRIEVLNPQRQFLGGTVDIVLTPQVPGQTVNVTAADASKDIDVGGLIRSVPYQVTATPVNGPKPAPQTVDIPPTGFNTVQFIVDAPIVGSAPYVVSGRVTSVDRARVGNLRLDVVDKNVAAPDVVLSVGETDFDGAYTIRYPVDLVLAQGKAAPDIQVRAYAGPTFLAGSDVRYNATSQSTLNINLPSAVSGTLPSEYETLIAVLARNYKGKLADLKESGDRQDITYLANKTGWDAKAVAAAVLADQFSAGSTDAAGAPTIPPAFFYALFRAGLPGNQDTLYHTPGATLQTLWRQAVDQGVIPPATADQISSLTARFQALGAQKLLTSPALAGVSSLKEMLTASRLTDAQQATLAQLYSTNRGDLPTFWKALGDALGQDTANRVRVDGKLAFLTINNAVLAPKIHAAIGGTGVSDPVQLAQAGYHRADRWSALLTADVPIPAEIAGDTPQNKQSNYAAYLAAQVRLSYPTASVAQMVKSGELALTGAAAGVSDQVSAFFTEHQGKYELGVQSVAQYVADNKIQVAPETLRHVKRIERIYQITPSDQAMTALMNRGIDAAYHVASYRRDTFVSLLATDMGGPDVAALTYDKAVQVHNTVLNVALTYLNARTTPPIGVHSPPSVVDPTPANTGDLVASTTLETLFGSMDFCACDHCRSILSPAAYLVDLLMFIDQPTEKINPQAVLFERRPDIQHLPLTCENTNTALPYIDIVNETMEYFIANSAQKLSLKDFHGHDTNGVSSEDLLAKPQYVMDLAYTTLAGERFPSPLPFHQPLENLRRYFDKFDVKLPAVMEVLRKNDDLERGSNAYGWRDIWMEQAGLSRADYEILTDSNAVPLWRMFGFPKGTADGDVISQLSNAKKFADRISISYEDLFSILATRFINPNSSLIPKLERLGVNFATLAELKAKNDAATDNNFDAQLAALAVPPDPSEYGGDIKGWVKNNANYARIMGLITVAIPVVPWAASKAYALGDVVQPVSPAAGSTLYYECTIAGTSGTTEPAWPTTPGTASPTDGTAVWTCRDASSCSSFSSVAFRYSDPAKTTQNISAAEMVRLARFIHLWKSLGWSIEQTDAAICALYRGDLLPLAATDLDTVAKQDSGFLRLLPQVGIILRVLNDLHLTIEHDLLALLACWSDIGTQGASALYRGMFLNPTLLEQDAVFADNGYGEFLNDATKQLGDHAEALRSAFSLTGDEYDRISGALGYDAKTQLTLANVSAIFRRGWLARKLKISVHELLLLTQLTGLDPFATPDPTKPVVLRLIVLVGSLKDRSLKTTTALYLLWNQDISGKSSPDIAAIGDFARTLRLAFNAVDAEFTVSDDPDGSIAQARLASVYGADAATFFSGLLNDTLTVEVKFSDPDGTMAPGAVRQAIEKAAGVTSSGVPKIAYEDFRKRLSYSGVLKLAVRDAIKLAAGVAAATFNGAVDTLYSQSQSSVGPFFARYAELQAPFDAFTSDTTHSISEKRATLLASILPDLTQRKKRQQAVQSVSAAANVDLALPQAVLDPPTSPLPLHAAGHNDRPALDDLMGLGVPGLSVQFYASDTASGTKIAFPTVASTVDYRPLVAGVGNPLPANPTLGAAISGVWSGQVEAPDNGFFNLYLLTDAGAKVSFTLDGVSVILTQNGSLWTNSDPIQFRAGSLHAIVLTVEKVRDVVSLQWAWDPKGQGRSVIDSRYLYSAESYGAFRDAYVRFLKLASLASGLGLTANEISYVATQLDYQIAGQPWPNSLAVDGSPATSTAVALLEPLEGILAWARIKAEVAPDDESLWVALRDPVSATQTPSGSLYAITGWSPASLNQTLAQFKGGIADLSRIKFFVRTFLALAAAQKMGLSAGTLVQATTNEPSGDTVRTLQTALRARYAAADWRDVVKPINDAMRGLQRDALVAYILHQMRSNPASSYIDTADKLFEYFLMDVQMEPCMQTSRIRHALSSVQLFIERCLMNLETKVAPIALNSEQWKWMKRYRVWEANRKIYLYAENWLEPALRDDKSPFFKEIESELLQSDITDDSASSALLKYLGKLEEVAKLEPCGLYYIPQDTSKRIDEVEHVVARTSTGAKRKYYYRRFQGGSWTPWENINLDIDDNPVIPVVWNSRLFLFWVRIVATPKDQSPPTSKPAVDAEKTQVANVTMTDAKQNARESTITTVKAILCWSEYFNGKWQPTRSSDPANPIELGQRPTTPDASRPSMSLLAREIDDRFGGSSQLRISVHVQDNQSDGAFILFNTHEAQESSSVDVKDNNQGYNRLIETGGTSVEVDYTYRVGSAEVPQSKEAILTQPGTPDPSLTQIIEPCRLTADNREAPFFYFDPRNEFYVTTLKQTVQVRDVEDIAVGFNILIKG